MCVGHYCNRFIYLFHPGRDGWSNHLDMCTHARPKQPQAMLGSPGQSAGNRREALKSPLHMCVCNRMYEFAVFFTVSISFSFPSDIFPPSMLYCLIFILPFHPFLSASSPATSEIHESITFPPEDYKTRGKGYN